MSTVALRNESRFNLDSFLQVVMGQCDAFQCFRPQVPSWGHERIFVGRHCSKDVPWGDRSIIEASIRLLVVVDA